MLMIFFEKKTFTLILVFKNDLFFYVIFIFIKLIIVKEYTPK